MHDPICSLEHRGAVGGDYDGVVSGMASQESEKLGLRCLVEVSRWLVQQPDPGIPQQGARYGNPLTLAAGEPLPTSSDLTSKAAILI